MVQRLSVFGQPPDSEQRRRVLRAGLEEGEEAQEAESSPGAASTNTPAATAAAASAEGCGEPSQPHARSRAGCQVETPAREAEGTQPQDPRTGESPPQCLIHRP